MTRSWTRLIPIVVVAAAFCAPLFVGLGLPDQENDEAIYSYAAESILETGDWLNPRLAPLPNEPFLEKPPLKFWIVALPIRLGLLPDTDFGLRFWDALFGGMAFLYVFAIGRRMAGWFCGVAALLILYSFDALLFSHGLRGNNMEAPLVLAYSGAVHHFLRWADSGHPGPSRRHAAAVGMYCLLGFMTKFVAVFFLPIVLMAAALELGDVRKKALREWRTWGLVAVVLVLLAAPWFAYQTWQEGSGFWRVILGEHVVKRFNAWLDPSHVRPWHFYFTDLFAQMTATRTAWMVIGGFVLVHLRVIRKRWLAGTVALYWFWLPMVLMSLGTSKLRHYAYPFLPPVALAGGYLMASIANEVNRFVARALPAWARRFGLGAGVERAAAHGRLVARIAVPVLLLALLPVDPYRVTLRRLTTGRHPLRTSAACIQAVQRAERAAGRPMPGLFVYLPGHTYLHPYFFYYRGAGWDRHDDLDDGRLEQLLGTPGQQRPVLMPFERFVAFHDANDNEAAVRRIVRINDVVLLLPGPFETCGF